MSNGTRKSRQESIESKIFEKSEKISFYQKKIDELTKEIDGLERRRKDIIAAKEKQKYAAENEELVKIIRQRGITKEQLLQINRV